jgi:hypothetical protein
MPTRTFVVGTQYFASCWLLCYDDRDDDGNVGLMAWEAVLAVSGDGLGPQRPAAHTHSESVVPLRRPAGRSIPTRCTLLISFNINAVLLLVTGTRHIDRNIILLRR